MAVTWTQLLGDYTAALNDAATLFKAEDLERHLRTAARIVASTKRPRTKAAELTLVADQCHYEAPADLVLPKLSSWGHTPAMPWTKPRGPLPQIRTALVDDATHLVLSPAPSAEQIAAYGARYPYYYLAAHVIDTAADTTTIGEADVDLVILRALVEAMRAASVRGAGKPVHLRNATAPGSSPKNTTPAALYTALLAEFESAR